MKNYEEYLEAYFRPAVIAVRANGLTGDGLLSDIRKHADKFQKVGLPERGVDLDVPVGWALIASTICAQAMQAYLAGEVTAAWTYVIDARFSADAILSSFMDEMAVSGSRKKIAKKAAAAARAKSPVHAAKAEANKLWQEWQHDHKHPKLRTNEQFAIECMRRWPVLTSAKVICGWCTEWNKAAKKSQPAS